MVIDTLRLPSNGMLGVPQEIEVKALTGKELNMVYSSLSDASINEIIRRITVPSLDPLTLCDEDKGAILYFTRLLTFGNDITQFLKCPHCGKVHEVVAHYSDFIMHYLDDFTSTFNLDNGDKVYKRIPTAEIQKEIDYFKEKHSVGSLDSYLLYLLARIEKVVTSKGETISNRLLLFHYLGDLPGKSFGDIVENIKTQFGLEVTFPAECPETDREFLGVVGINADFFRFSNSNVPLGDEQA
ncbi:MAG: hypothetical protein M0Q87_15210 [Ottowia sp.]|nr:hypothetical protein [Ottowia sp.]